MITAEKKKFLSLLRKEGPFNVVDFHLDADEDLYWITLQLPEPYESFEAQNILFALDFESVNFKEKTIRFVINEEDFIALLGHVLPQAKLPNDKLTN